jgi:hypothetical protein
MAESLSLPNIPTSKMFMDDPDDRALTIEWQEFFRGLHKRVGGLTAPTLLEVQSADVAEAYKTEDKEIEKRIRELEKMMESFPFPKSYDKDINALKDEKPVNPYDTSPKSYDKRLDELEEKIAMLLVDQPEAERNEAVVVLDTPKSYDNELADINKQIHVFPAARQYDNELADIEKKIIALTAQPGGEEKLDLIVKLLDAREPFKYYLPQDVYDDMQVGISNIRVPASNFPTERLFAHGIGGGVTFPSLGFAVNDYLYFDIQSSHSMKLSTIMDSHIHYCTPTDGSGTPDRFQFQLDVIAAPIDGTYAVPSGSPYTAEHTIAADYTTLHKLFEIADIAAINTTVSTLYKCKLTRIAATQDEYAGEVYVDFIDSHYQKDTVGSRIEDLK